MKLEILAQGAALCKAVAEGEAELTLVYEGGFEPGDEIRLSGLKPGSHYWVQLDAALGSALLYARGTSFRFVIPFGEAKTSYPQTAFTEARACLSCREAEAAEQGNYRNLALNPYDQHGEASLFPHAWANVETRGEAVFAARNAIDGVRACQGHGAWPFQSWGINRRPDAELTLEFGRPVDIESVVLYTRADFPHDNWWESAMLAFSDGSTEELELRKSLGEGQRFAIRKAGIEWIRLYDLKQADDPSPFPALVEFEVYGREH